MSEKTKTAQKQMMILFYAGAKINKTVAVEVPAQPTGETSRGNRDDALRAERALGPAVVMMGGSTTFGEGAEGDR